MSEPEPRLAMVSIGIRRDLLAPLQYLSHFELHHFYKIRAYDDLTAQDLDHSLCAYTSPPDLYHQLVRAKPDVIQGVEPFSLYTQPLLWACYFAAQKTNATLLVATLENRPLEIKFGHWRAFLLRKLLRVYFQRACLILTLNAGARENVLACDSAAACIENAMWGVWGVDTQEFFPRAARVTDAPPTILFAGRVHPEKGIFILLEAFVSVREKIPNAQLLVVGDGPARRALIQKIYDKDLGASVRLTGTVKNRDMPAMFHRADVFCAPSITTRKWAEQVGMSALQAMACGIPIVSTRSGAIPEYVPDGVAGILVQEQDTQALANALVQVLTKPDRASEMGARGRAYACAHYDARANVARGERLVIKKCLEQHARRV